MESLAQLIEILLQHSQRLTDLWNFQLIVILGIVGFLLSHASDGRLLESNCHHFC